MKNIRFFLFLFLFCLIFSNGIATEYQPWLGNFYEFELRSSLKYQSYKRLSSGSHTKKYLSNDFFLNLSLSNALPDPAVSGEIEFTQANTKKQKGDLDQIKVTGRYVWSDDVAGDPVSLILGLSYIQAFQRSLRDVSSFHHGLFNAEFFVSVGKENTWGMETLWNSRWWLLGSIGIAERGSPWFRFDLNYEKRLCENHELSAFVRSLWGLGSKRLDLQHFHGYGPIQHQSVDLGLRYTYLIQYYGNASLEYQYRIYGKNYPIFTHQVLAQILYTFGL